MSTEDFSFSTPQDSLEDKLHPPDGDSNPTATQPPLPPDLSILVALFNSITAISLYCQSRASAERSFSKLKIIKTLGLRTISQERLDGLALLAIENEAAKQLKDDMQRFFGC